MSIERFAFDYAATPEECQKIADRSQVDAKRLFRLGIGIMALWSDKAGLERDDFFVWKHHMVNGVAAPSVRPYIYDIQAELPERISLGLVDREEDPGEDEELLGDGQIEPNDGYDYRVWGYRLLINQRGEDGTFRERIILDQHLSGNLEDPDEEYFAYVEVNPALSLANGMELIDAIKGRQRLELNGIAMAEVAKNLWLSYCDTTDLDIDQSVKNQFELVKQHDEILKARQQMGEANWYPLHVAEGQSTTKKFGSVSI